MPELTIDNREVEFNPGQTIIEAAKNAGIDIPRFCWHPGLSTSGNCRICLVEIEKNPKLVISCSTAAAEGMVFLLINHPLDCPICDEAGECELQDYAYKYGSGKSRFNEEKVHAKKRIEIGPNVILDQERCIKCSRCIRFCNEIAKESQLTFANRGEKVVIQTFPGKELDNPYSMNVVEICPVGALTSKHFRFKSRIWEMSFAGTICPGCSRGCNTVMGVRNNEILRIESRENLNVNDYWLCDWGRLNTFNHINDKEKRIKTPRIRINEDNKSISSLVEVDWEEAISTAASKLINKGKDILFIASPFSTLEDNYTLKKFANEVFKNNNIFYNPNIDEYFGDDILKKSDKTPNSNGLKLLGINPLTKECIKDLKNKIFKIVYVINDDLTRVKEFESLFRSYEFSIQHLNVKNGFYNHASVVLPEATYAEVNGTFVNFQNRVQRIRPAVQVMEQERLIEDFSLSRLDKFGEPNDRWTHGTKINAKPTWKILKQIAKILGHNFFFDNSEEVFIELCDSIPGMEGYYYDTVGEEGILV